MMTVPFRIAAVVVALLVWGVGAAQQTDSATQSSASSRTIRLSLLVTDSANHSIEDVAKDQIRLVEDKVPQTISAFTKDDRAIDYAMVIDNSGSFKNILFPALEAAKLLIKNNEPTDEVFIERFISSNKIETVEEFTSDQAKLVDALGTLFIEEGQSAIVDAIYLAAKHVAEHHSGSDRRRALVLISDGEERASYYSVNDLFKLLRSNDVQIFVIGIVTQLDKGGGLLRPSPRAAAEQLLNRIAQETGGRVFFPRNGNELLRAANEISHDLHTQYAIEYQPTNNSRKAGFRKVEVRIAEASGRNNLTAITRTGYLVPKESSSAKENEQKKKKSE